MAVRNDFSAGEVLAAADLNDTFGSKLDLAGGKILQIVRATDSTNRITTSTSDADVTGMSVTITPQKSDSAILVLCACLLRIQTSANSTGRVKITDSSNNALSGAENGTFRIDETSGNVHLMISPTTIIGYSTPATTSATTYKMRFAVNGAGRTMTIENATQTGQMYAIEVSA